MATEDFILEVQREAMLVIDDIAGGLRTGRVGDPRSRYLRDRTIRADFGKLVSTLVKLGLQDGEDSVLTQAELWELAEINPHHGELLINQATAVFTEATSRTYVRFKRRGWLPEERGIFTGIAHVVGGRGAVQPGQTKLLDPGTGKTIYGQVQVDVTVGGPLDGDGPPSAFAQRLSSTVLVRPHEERRITDTTKRRSLMHRWRISNGPGPTTPRGYSAQAIEQAAIVQEQLFDRDPSATLKLPVVLGKASLNGLRGDIGLESGTQELPGDDLRNLDHATKRLIGHTLVLAAAGEAKGPGITSLPDAWRLRLDGSEEAISANAVLKLIIPRDPEMLARVSVLDKGAGWLVEQVEGTIITPTSARDDVQPTLVLMRVFEPSDDPAEPPISTTHLYVTNHRVRLGGEAASVVDVLRALHAPGIAETFETHRENSTRRPLELLRCRGNKHETYLFFAAMRDLINQGRLVDLLGPLPSPT